MANANFLLIGLPGTGKTTVGRALAERGFQVVDTDNYPGLNKWQDKITGEDADFPRGGASYEWLKRHDYVWDRTVMQAILQGSGEVQYVCGISDNAEEFIPEFDGTVMLKAGKKTIRNRLKTRTGNAFGKNKGERQVIYRWRKEYHQKMRALGALVVDAKLPLDEVVQAVIDSTYTDPDRQVESVHFRSGASAYGSLPAPQPIIVEG